MTDETNLPVSELKANDTVYDIVGKSVVDQNSTSHLKMWSGTKAEYEALESIDETTMYLIKDDVEPLNSQTLFDCKWLDYAVDSLCWKNANDFAWISGDIYKDAYDHLYEDYQSGTLETETIAGTTIEYKLAADGHKLTTMTTEVEAIYAATGVAWYYLMDENGLRRFKLPRTKFAFTGYRNGVGNYVSESLPNIKGEAYNTNDSAGSLYINSWSGVFNKGTHSSVTYPGIGSTTTDPKSALSFDASRSSSVYQDNAPVQQRATQMYLYFFVGNLIVNQYEIDANGFATKHLDNLSSIGKNIANWSSNVTNCITEIPQDIHIELSNNGYILKAGSVVYMPNGFEQDGTTPHFDKVICQQDLSYVPTWGAGYRSFLNGRINANGELASINMLREDYFVSGATEPTSPPSSMTWYDTAANKIKTYRDGAWKTDAVDEPRLLPFGIVKVITGNVISSIEQVFNGFGYFGSTVFVLPGAKALAPNGRNEDGTLKNQELIVDKVLTYTIPSNVTNYCALAITQLGIDTGIVYYAAINSYCESSTPPDPTINVRWWNPDENKFYIWKSATSSWDEDPQVHLARMSISNGVIQSFSKYNPFKALDESDKSTISSWGMPSGKYIDLTLQESGSSYTAPANGYIHCILSLQANGNMNIKVGDCSNYFQSSNLGGAYNGGLVPIRKGDSYKIYYSTLVSTIDFKFVYAEGEL